MDLLAWLMTRHRSLMTETVRSVYIPLQHGSVDIIKNISKVSEMLLKNIDVSGMYPFFSFNHTEEGSYIPETSVFLRNISDAFDIFFATSTETLIRNRCHASAVNFPFVV